MNAIIDALSGVFTDQNVLAELRETNPELEPLVRELWRKTAKLATATFVLGIVSTLAVVWLVKF